MSFRAGRLSSASLRPATLRFGANTGRLCPLASGIAISASSTPAVPLCLPRMSCRHGSTQAEHPATSQGSPSGPVRKGLFLSAEKIGTLVSAKQTNPKNILLEFDKFDKFDKPVTISKLWLRDACPCHLCVSESSGQKNFATCEIPPNLEIDSLRVLEDGGLEVSWANDLVPGAGHHVSTYPLDLFHRILTNSVSYGRTPPAREIWDLQHFEQDSRSREVSYESWMGDSSRFAEAFRNLCLWGLIIVKGVPGTESAVQEVASRIGHLQSTFYGPTWDVVSKPRAENVAYTNEFLGLHQDLMYLPKPPRLQILHCLENSCEGGESLFSDGIRAAHELQQKHQKHFITLASSRVDFQYDKGGYYYRHGQYTITSYPHGHVATRYPQYVFWSPPFQAPFWSGLRNNYEESGPRVDRTHDYLREWHTAAKVFKDSIEDPRNMVQFRLQPGDCVVFDNWRVLHGRREFDTTSGRRHLRGGYIEDQALNSTWVRLQREGLMFSKVKAGPFGEERRKACQILGLEK
ncbi:hypothetical protein Daus18300_009987 [Diaporthe australafricana]|uniref:Gamma-butyrobetaine dioxygenase n=1 Tax=Diaporthe australafricana TaxID=127596 RepID=A0ABR3WC51_9PEZI